MHTVGLNWYEMEMNQTLKKNIFMKDSTNFLGTCQVDFYQKHSRTQT